MDHTAWELAKQVFHDALEETGSERTRVVERACGDDAELLAHVEVLLSAHEEAGFSHSLGHKRKSSALLIYVCCWG